MINWINSWRSGSKKEIYEIKFRLGMLTVFQVKLCLSACSDTKQCSRFRFMLLNFGFEI